MLRSRRTGFLSLNSLLCALGFALGVASLIIALSLMTGFQADVISRVMGMNAHIRVYAHDVGRMIDAPSAPGGLRERVAEIPGVVAAEPVVQEGGALVAPGRQIRFGNIIGIDPTRADSVLELEEHMVYGSLEDLSEATPSGRPGIVMGLKLAVRLGVTLGDKLRVLVPVSRGTPWGVQPLSDIVEVVGLFESGYGEYDESWVFIDYDHGQHLFGLDDEAHRIDLRVSSIEELDEVKRAVIRTVGEGYWVEDILSMQSVFFSALRLEKLLMGLAVGLIVLVAALGVVSTLVLTVTQKIRQIGVLMAMGAHPGGVLRVFMYQGLAMAFLGTGAGVALGVSIATILDRFRMIRLDPDVYYLEFLPFRVEIGDLAWIVVLAVVTGLVASVYPARRAAALDPVEALRRE